jgi:hypothetical protein
LKSVTFSRRPVAMALVLLVALAAILAPSAGADHGRDDGGAKKPATLSCKPYSHFSSAVRDVTTQTGIAPEMGPEGFFPYTADEGRIFKGVASTECVLHWRNDSGNSAAFGNCSGCTQGVWKACAAAGVSRHDFNETIPHPNGDDGGVCSSVYGSGFTVKKYTPPGAGSQGYVVALNSTGASGKYPLDYNVYAWTKQKGCFVSLDAWPLSLAATEASVDATVRSLLKAGGPCR